MSSSWKDKFSVPKAVRHKVGEIEHFFWPVSVRRFLRLKALGGPVIKALTVLFTKNDKDVRQTVTREDGVEQVIVEAITPELAAFRAEQRAKAIQEAVDALMDETNMGLTCELIVDSMREVWPTDDPSNPPPPGLEIATTFDLVQIREMATGVIKANADVFGPLAEKLTQAAQEVLQTPGVSSTTES